MSTTKKADGTIDYSSERWHVINEELMRTDAGDPCAVIATPRAAIDIIAPGIMADELMGIVHLFATVPLLLAALQAQELGSALQRELRVPVSSDPRYTPFIGEWDGVSSPSGRYIQFQETRKELRRDAIAKATTL